METRKLSPQDTSKVAACLAQSPFETVALRGMNNYGNLALLNWYGTFSGDDLMAVGVLIPEQLALVWSMESTDCTEIGQRFKSRGAPCTTIGPPRSTKSLWTSWSATEPLVIEQTLYLATEGPVGPTPSGFRLATVEDVETIARFSGAGEEEETGQNTFMKQPTRLKQLVKNRIQLGHTWVIEHHGELVFQVHVAPVLNDCCQLVGTYVPPPFRRQGWSTLGVRGLLQKMIPQTGVVVLRVNKTNLAAVKCYEANGFRPYAPFSVLTPQH